MKRILNRYEEISGQVVNFNKSTVVFSPNTNEENRIKVCTQLGVRTVDNPLQLSGNANDGWEKEGGQI